MMGRRVKGQKSVRVYGLGGTQLKWKDYEAK